MGAAVAALVEASSGWLGSPHETSEGAFSVVIHMFEKKRCGYFRTSFNHEDVGSSALKEARKEAQAASTPIEATKYYLESA